MGEGTETELEITVQFDSTAVQITEPSSDTANSSSDVEPVLLVIPVSLTKAPKATASVDIAINIEKSTATLNSDFKLSATHLTWYPHTAQLVQQVTLSVPADHLPEGGESVVLELHPRANASLKASAPLEVTIQDAPYDGWRFSHFGTETPISEDPDKDHLINFMEYGLGTNPTIPTTFPLSLTVSSLEDNQIAIRLPSSPAPEVLLHLQELTQSAPPTWQVIATWDHQTQWQTHDGSTITDNTLKTGKHDNAMFRILVTALDTKMAE